MDAFKRKQAMVKDNGQVGGTHYKGEIQHWDYAWSHDFDLFQYIITKWVELILKEKLRFEKKTHVKFREFIHCLISQEELKYNLTINI